MRTPEYEPLQRLGLRPFYYPWKLRLAKSSAYYVNNQPVHGAFQRRATILKTCDQTVQDKHYCQPLDYQHLIVHYNFLITDRPGPYITAH